MKGFVGIVRLLLNDSRANPADYKNQALVSAIQSGNVEIVRMLMDYG
jgi:hypothetical protein